MLEQILSTSKPHTWSASITDLGVVVADCFCDTYSFVYISRLALSALSALSLLYPN